MMNTVKRKIANSLRSAWGASIFYGASIALPVAVGVATLDSAKDDFNDITNVPSDQVVEKYEQRYKSMEQLSERVEAMGLSANRSETPEQSSAFKNAEFELENQLAIEWKTYANNVLEDVVLTESGYKKIEEMATIAGQQDYLPATARSWDECRVDFKNASGQQACMDDRNVSEGAMILITLLGVLGTIGGLAGTIICGTDGDHRKWARRLEKSIKSKVPKN